MRFALTCVSASKGSTQFIVTNHNNMLLWKQAWKVMVDKLFQFPVMWALYVRQCDVHLPHPGTTWGRWHLDRFSSLSSKSPDSFFNTLRGNWSRTITLWSSSSLSRSFCFTRHISHGNVDWFFFVWDVLLRFCLIVIVANSQPYWINHSRLACFLLN